MAGATITAVSTENATEITVDNDHFEVADGNLKLKADSSLDFEAVEGGMLDVTITASGDGDSATHTVSITVNDVNEAPTIDVRDGEEVPGHPGVISSLTIAENAMRGDDGPPPLALIEVMDPDDADAEMLTGDAGQAATSVSDSRFTVIQDPENGLWLHLAEGASLNYEDGAEVMVTVTFTDSAGNTASQDVTVMVTDVNEAPEAVGMADNITTESGEAIKADPIDLLALFNDPDAGDANAVRYELSGAPSWLTFSVEFGEDEDGNDTAHGIFTGTPPTTGPNSDAAHMVTLTATDSGGAEGSVSFYVIVDDGNDDITDVDLIASDGNVAVEGEVDENDDSGVVLGEIRVHDQDHAMHPNGMHLIQVLRGESRSESPNASVDNRFEVKYDDAGIPWLVLKEGMSLDQEAENGSVDVTIRAVDMDGATNSRGTAFTGNIEFQTVTVLINDQNDAPRANTIGNWWVTAQDRLRSDDVTKGSWLEFSLEDSDDAKPAFTDPDGDRLTYSLSGPSFLEIDKDTGEIVNTEGGVPVRGVHRLTVTATDPDGESATASFHLSIALSGAEDSFTEDNEPPVIRVTSEVDYPENSGERRVATFTVTDDDNDLGHHPFALDSVRITAVVNATDSRKPDGSNPDGNNSVDDANTPANEAQGMTGYGGAFRLSDPIKNGDTYTYHVYVRDTNPGRTDTTAVLDGDNADDDRLEITITASDGVADAVIATIDVVIDDVNDRPTAENIGDNPATQAVETDFNIASGDYGVNQSETAKEVLYIKLEDLWNDAEDDSDDLTFGVTVSGSWIKVLHGPAEWRDIRDGRDDDANTDDDVTWALDNDAQDPVVVGDAGDPDAGEQVVIIEIDRTGRNNDQGAMGSFTLTATDTDNGRGSKTYTIMPTDENLNPTNAVTLSGSAREDATLRASFNDDRDPDLGGSATPALVLYQWFRATDADGAGETLVRQGTSSTYSLTQADVGSFITVKVKYYEVFGSQLVGLDVSTVDNEATTSRAVSNTPDKGTGSITVLADSNVLSVTTENVGVTDGDYSTPGGAVADTALSYSWEVSDNGRGGWEAVDQGTDSDTSTLELDDGEGKYYRAVVTYDADGVDEDSDTSDGDDDLMESVYSDAIQVSNVSDDATTAPSITGNAFPGGTLSVDVRNTSVQWQEQRGGNWVDIPGATGSLDLTQAHAGKVIRALVSYHSTDEDNPGTTAVVAVPAVTGGGAIPGTTTGDATPVGVDDYEIEASVAAPGHGATNNAGHNLSLTEMVPLASLFQDPDSARLTYTVTSTAGELGANSGSGSTYVYDDADGGVLVFEASTGKLTFNSDVYRTHDGVDTDGTGNVLTLTVTATDEGGRQGAADVDLRINVAPTGISFNSETDGNGSEDGTAGNAIAVDEHVGSAAAGSTGMFIARVDVLDENLTSHKFGTHDVTVSGDDRFMITNTGNGRTDGDRDGSTWEVRLKPGAKLDFETQADMDPATSGKQIVLTLTATDGGDLSTPSGPRIDPITLTITLGDVAASGGDRNQPPLPTPDDVPGLKDDEGTPGTPDADDTEDDTTDDDTDGGSQPPPPGMSLGGIIEDFIDNMDYGDQNLLEEFILTIDDGLDIV